MSRSARLLDLIQLLRRHRYPVKGGELANELGISLRTLYRDIATLQAQGARIEGEPGIGYVLRPGFMLPPLMFSAEEIEALVLGSRWVADRADSRLQDAARNALAKIGSVFPAELKEDLETSGLIIGPGAALPAGDADVAILRRAIRTERKIQIGYRDPDGVESERMIWPIAIAFFDRVRVLVAWCEWRQDFRHFRTDRILRLVCMDQPFPRKRQTLLNEWRKVRGIPPR